MKLSIGFLLLGIILNAQDSSKSGTSLASGPGSYKVLITKGDTIRIPFKMHNGKPLMDLEINGKSATLMIDNGVLWDQVWLFGSPLVKELNLIPLKADSIPGTSSENPLNLYSSKPLVLKFKDIIFYEQPVLVSHPSTGYARIFPGADGQLCNTFFKHFVVEFDFVQNEIILYDPKKFDYEGDGYILDMQLTEAGTYSVPIQITMKDAKVYTDRADIDLGGIYFFKAALNTEHSIHPPPNADTRPFFGGTEYIARIENLTIGNFPFEEPTVVFGDEKTSRIHPKNLGVIELPMFMKFNTIFDYFNNKIYITPNKNFNQSFE